MACSDGDSPELGRAPATSAVPSTGPAASSTSASTTTTVAATPGKCGPPVARAQPDPSRPDYEMELDVQPGQGIVEGRTTVQFTPDLDTGRLVFRLWPNAPRIASTGARLEPGAVTVGGRSAPTERPDPTTLVVNVGIAAGSPVTASLPWRLTIPGPAEDRVSRNGDALRLGSFFPVLAWEPGVGWAMEPATGAFAEATTTPVADFTVSVSLPSGYNALATGVPETPVRWRAEGVRDFAMSVGRFTMATATAQAPQPVKVTVGVHDGAGVSPQPFADKAVRVLQDYATRYGPYPWPAYTVAITPELGGGIEFPMHVMQGPDTLGRTTSHEIAHMWFYGLVGNNQGRDPWLDEGLASWAEARFEGTLDDFASRDIPTVGRGRAGEPMTYWEGHHDAYYRSVYVQSAVALSRLGQPELVDCALRDYVARNASRIARPRDLFASLTPVFPNAEAAMAPFGLRP
jgi:hypothetical protein